MRKNRSSLIPRISGGPWLSVHTLTAFASRLVLGGILAIAVAALLFALQVIPEWQVERAKVHPQVPQVQQPATYREIAELQNEMRKTFIQVIGGAFALLALYFTFRRVKVSEQGHITDRYTKAIEQLGALNAKNEPNIEVRLGAIYALERIAVDSSRDHWTIMEVLTSYVRQNAPLIVDQDENGNAGSSTDRRPSTEIQAILTVLGRRRRSRHRERWGHRLDLRNCNLRGAAFRFAHLEEARFDHSDICSASFFHAHLDDANFYQAKLNEVSFLGASLNGAIFYEANLEDSHLDFARMDGALLEKAHLKGATMEESRVSGALFTDVKGIMAEQLAVARDWDRAELPPSLRKRIQMLKADTTTHDHHPM